MRRTLWLTVLVTTLVFALVALAGCGGSDQEGSEAGTNGGSGQAVPEIADERIIGTWVSEEDGEVEFLESGVVVLSAGEFPFTMPSSDRIDITFPAGTETYNVVWDGDDRHGVLASTSTTTTPTWYDRK